MATIDNTNLASPSALASTVKDSSSLRDTYLDQNSLNSVKAMGRHNDPKAFKEIAKKFEAMFVQQMLKSMRDANEVFAEGDMFSSEEVKFHQDMLDQQMVLNLTSGDGIGLAKTMYEQMVKMYGNKSSLPNQTENESVQKSSLQSLQAPKSIKPLTGAAAANQPPALISRAGIKRAVAQTPDEFIAKVKPYAEKAAADLNVNMDVLLAQAALETGWGKHLLHDSNGNNSFNLFNVKTGGEWQGKSVSVNTLEYKQGVTHQEKSEFRHYDSYLQSFSDYVNLIKKNPRYQQALSSSSSSAGYAEALQKAGYATDPAYADKIKRLLESDSIRSAVESTNNGLQLAANGEQS